MRIFLPLASLLALAACHQNEQPPSGNAAGPSSPDSGIKGVHRDHRGKSEPTATFNDPDGKRATLADFKGKPVLVNLWASWCAPCVKELPTLDKLAQSGRVPVVAVSEDNGPHPSVIAFLKAHQIGTLKSYQDPAMSLSAALGPDAVLPTSILYDAKGKEVWRYIGDEDWTSAAASRLLSEGAAEPTRG